MKQLALLWTKQSGQLRVVSSANPNMKKCAYCGRENSDNAVNCRECGTDEFEGDKEAVVATGPVPEDLQPAKEEFIPLSPADMEKDLVTLIRCRTLMEAEMIVCRLDAAGIYAFIPDQSLMQMTGWNLNTYGFVRIQVSPRNYAEAKEFLSTAT
jgi:ribosomal protein L40E